MASALATPKSQKTRTHISPQVVPVHTGSNLRKDEQKRKTVFKNVLDSPYTVKWPFILPEDQVEILEALCKFLEPVGEYHRQRKATRKKEKRDTIAATVADAMHVGIPTEPSYASPSSQPAPTSPSVLNSTVFGINQVTRSLERIITVSRSSAMTPATPIPDPLTMIFVCKGDIAPPHLVGHLPMMAYIAGGSVKEGAKPVLLCSLAKGAERRLGDVAGIQRCSAIGVQALNDSEAYTALSTLVYAKVEPIQAPWLRPLLPTPTNPVPRPTYLVTNIKTLQTSAPLANKKHGERRKRKKEKAKTVVPALPQSRQLQPPPHPAQSPPVQQQQQSQSLPPPRTLPPSPPPPSLPPSPPPPLPHSLSQLPSSGGVSGHVPSSSPGPHQQLGKRGGSWDNQGMGASRVGSGSGSGSGSMSGARREGSLPKKSRYT